MSDRSISQNDILITEHKIPLLPNHNNEKQQLHNSKLFETLGVSRRHNLISSNMTIAVGSRLRGHKCEIYAGGMRVRLSEKKSCYPDVVTVKENPVFDKDEPDLLLNPTMIVEIFTPETLCYDKTEKLDSYLSLGSVRDMLLIKENGMRVEHYTSQGANQWIYRIYNRREDTISLDSISCRAALAEIYAQVTFD